MVKSIRLGTTLTAIGLVGALAACSTPGSQSAMRGTTLFGKKVDTANIGLATRAQLALAANDVSTATDLAERAVENSPNDAGFRALLGNCYLAGGRFASAEAAYRDSLSLLGNQPRVVLKLALVQIGLGKNDEAVGLLSQAQSVLEPSDIGLALALAGRADDAVAVLEPAARAIGADSQLRQNLALAYALGGNWDAARTIAGQDLPANQLDARIQEWMTLAKPGQQTSKVAAFIGISPASVDPGQPIRLALNKSESAQQLAEAAPVIVPPVVESVHVAAPAAVEVVAVPAQPVVAEVVPTPAPVAVATVEAPQATVDVPAPAPAAPVRVAAAKKPPVVKFRAPRPALTPAAVRLGESIPEIRHAALRTVSGRSKAVVQLGAYSSRERIAAAWSKVTAKYGQLRNYQPVTARFDGEIGTVYRLSVKGFGSDREAIRLCASVKRAGGSCFVRAASGDAPVQLASR